jgi:predicted metal-dependent phosphotriesterase family hydrolase
MAAPTTSHEVITVLGSITPEQMGITQTHEHLFIDAMDHYGAYEWVIDDEDLVAQELTEFTNCGGRTICDVTTDEIGRDPERLARMSRRAGVHVVMGSVFYREFGVDPSRIIIGHLGDRIGVKHLQPIVAEGVYVEVDNIGYLDYQPEWVRADNVAALVKEGFGDRVLLSEDICSLRHLKYTGGKGFGYLLETFVPMLRQRDVSDEAIQHMLVTNLARAFARRRPNG